MATLTNSPRQELNFDLERRKSYSFKVVIRRVDRTLVDLTGCTLTFVLKSATHDSDDFDTSNILVNPTALISDPLGGTGVFAFQAAELDQEPGEYNAAIVLWSPQGYSTLLAKGTVNILANAESGSVRKTYTVATPESVLELPLRPADTVEIKIG